MERQQKILFIAPLPPPIDGQSKASAQALEALQSHQQKVEVVNINRSSLSRSLLSQVQRVFEVLLAFIRVFLARRNAQAVYFSLSESILGNIKDLVFYVLLLGKLDRVTIHMLGGTGMNEILNQKPVLSKINGFFMRRMKSVIVEGNRGYQIFSKYFDAKQIKVVPNFADDYLHTEESDVNVKFNHAEQLQVLYLSNMLIGKGYLDLLQGFIDLPEKSKRRFKLKFVGGFPESQEKDKFLRLIAPEPQIEYLGNFIDGEKKRALYLNSHIFCLPTYYPYEGQPISILEAYATGCAVLTTEHAGIPDIFVTQKNGYRVLPKDPASIQTALLHAVNHIDDLRRIAIDNVRMAGLKFRAESYRSNIIHAFNS